MSRLLPYIPGHHDPGGSAALAFVGPAPVRGLPFGWLWCGGKTADSPLLAYETPADSFSPRSE